MFVVAAAVVVAVWELHRGFGAKGIDLRVVPSTLFVHSDPALLDRILQAEAAFGHEGGCDLVTGTPPYKPLGTASISPASIATGLKYLTTIVVGSSRFDGLPC